VQHAAKTGGLMLGDTIPDFKDIILPRLNIVQGVGNLKDQFPQGAIVFNQSTVLFVPPDIDPQTGNVRRAATPPSWHHRPGFPSLSLRRENRRRRQGPDCEHGSGSSQQRRHPGL
jgi:hypothetical protein